MLFAINQHQHKRHSKSHGFSLIEVLVASTVFTLGLAGFSALQLSNIIGSAHARRAGVAAMAAANLAEQIRMNPAAINQYLDPPKYVSKICVGNAICSPEQQADFDFRLWQLDLADRIHNARGLICRDETPEDGIEGNSHCDGVGPLVVKIFWTGHGPESSDTSKHYRFSLQVS